VLTDEQKQHVARLLRLAQGLFDSAELRVSPSEYDVRNSNSRLYYAFFHACLALLLTIGWDIDRISRDHGRVHDAVQARMGKYFGTFLRDLYRSRRLSDYDAALFEKQYGGDIEKAQQEFILLMKSASTNFYWLYREARKAI
jgi:uncharacterized protein (UPF0332 family)